VSTAFKVLKRASRTVVGGDSVELSFQAYQYYLENQRLAIGLAAVRNKW